MKLDALFFAAHPDDAELGCGGLIIKLTDSGKKVGITDLTRGELSTRGNPEKRSLETKKASEILNLSLRKNLEIGDGNIENNPSNREKIINLIRGTKPELVFIPWWNDRHPDHENASKLLKESVFFAGLEKIQTYSEETLQKPFRPKRTFYYMQNYSFEPTFIIDISTEFSRKMEAVKCYSSQFYNPDSDEPETFISSKNFLEFIEARARFYGFMIGADYGEPYYSENKIKLEIDNLFS
ncbi:MAG: bacillithiol biosynthesis deacetylase BshB1 [Ignavibacteria bacterium]|nr:bacillithiol biosynthesis deacetylase BshB1 [Ignavibacteria bacterium]